MVEQDARESRLLMLRHTRDMVDRTLQEIDKTIVDIMYASNIYNVMYLPPIHEGSPEIYTVWNFAKEIQRITISNDIFNSAFMSFLRITTLYSHMTLRILDLNIIIIMFVIMTP